MTKKIDQKRCSKSKLPTACKASAWWSSHQLLSWQLAEIRAHQLPHSSLTGKNITFLYTTHFFFFCLSRSAPRVLLSSLPCNMPVFYPTLHHFYTLNSDRYF
mmetsp:Transcript_11585/g.31068  ORF Transcript_11585/g.31068 Transcript_11585/m.31068 type:complete len:102 (+) Transcript_11585:4070-4375(+)